MQKDVIVCLDKRFIGTIILKEHIDSRGRNGKNGV